MSARAERDTRKEGYKSGPGTRVGPLMKIRFFRLSQFFFQYDNDLITTTENTSCSVERRLAQCVSRHRRLTISSMSESIRALCLEGVDEVVADVLRPLPRGSPGLSDVAVLVELGLPVDEVLQRFPFALALDHSLS